MNPPTTFSAGLVDSDRNLAIQDALTQGSLPRALALLNAGVPHRYTAAYSLEDAVLHNRGLVDKQKQATPAFLLAVPLKDSFCQFLMRDGHFETHDSASDPRLDGHLYKGVIAAYCAAPVTDSSGHWMIGSLCHFDVVPQRLTAAENELLQRAGRMVSARMLREAAPTQVLS